MNHSTKAKPTFKVTLHHLIINWKIQSDVGSYSWFSRKLISQPGAYHTSCFSNQHSNMYYHFESVTIFSIISFSATFARVMHRHTNCGSFWLRNSYVFAMLLASFIASGDAVCIVQRLIALKLPIAARFVEWFSLSGTPLWDSYGGKSIFILVAYCSLPRKRSVICSWCKNSDFGRVAGGNLLPRYVMFWIAYMKSVKISGQRMMV